MKKGSKQIIVINSLRGIAALAVCLYHFVCTTTGYFTDELLLDIFHFGKKGVQLFFIISGIVIPLSMINLNYQIKQFGKYLLKRFIRIEPPYLMAVAAGILFLYARNFVPSSAAVDLTPSLRDVLLHIGYLVPFVKDAEWISPVFWTLSIEFQYYIFLALLFPLALSGKKVWQWAFSLIVVALPFLQTPGSFYLHWSAYFGIGIFYALFISKKYTRTEFLVALALSSVSVYFAQGPIDLSIGLGSLAVIHFFPNFKTKVGLFLGDISYSLYLLHAIVGAGVINFLSHRFTAPIEKFGVVLVGIAVSILSAYVFWRFIEKPSQNRSRKIKINADPKP